MQDALLAAVRRHMGPDAEIEGLHRLSGGASQETWSFDLARADSRDPCILRRRPHGNAEGGQTQALTLEAECRMLAVAAEQSVPVPAVRFVLDESDALGSGYVMERLEGETIPRKLLRDERFERARPRLARQCGEILARLHAGDPARATEPSKLAVVHGDFRNGNLLVDEEGVRGVLDWELCHVGDPMEDLGWICVPSWRFGEIDRPVGGFGPREELFAGYQAAGGVVDPARVRFWEVLGTLKWGIMCMTMVAIFRSGADPSVERAAIGRRSSETEIDLLTLMEE